MKEFKIITKEESEFQKLLNQWKHKYDFEIIWIVYSNDLHKFKALISREEKPK